jgi:hypothetical protein
MSDPRKNVRAQLVEIARHDELVPTWKDVKQRSDQSLFTIDTFDAQGVTGGRGSHLQAELEWSFAATENGPFPTEVKGQVTSRLDKVVKLEPGFWQELVKPQSNLVLLAHEREAKLPILHRVDFYFHEVFLHR